MNLKEIYQPVSNDLSSVEEMVRQVSRAGLDWLPAELGSGLRESGKVDELLSHILNTPGKRLRPALALLAAKCFQYNPEQVLPMATALEIFHIATLVHDDAIDNSSLRRGIPTINSIWGDDAAILLGDYLLAQAGELAAQSGSLVPVTRLYQTLMTITSGELAQAANAFNLEQSRRYYLHRISSKTASLISLSTECGAFLGGGSDIAIRAIKDYGFSIGIAFQIIDDVLDYVGTTAEMGKPVGTDLTEGTITLPVLLLDKYHPENKLLDELVKNQDNANVRQEIVMLVKNTPEIIEECYRMATDYCDKARGQLKQLPESDGKKSLDALADFIISRRN